MSEDLLAWQLPAPEGWEERMDLLIGRFLGVIPFHQPTELEDLSKLIQEPGDFSLITRALKPLETKEGVDEVARGKTSEEGIPDIDIDGLMERVATLLSPRPTEEEAADPSIPIMVKVPPGLDAEKLLASATRREALEPIEGPDAQWMPGLRRHEPWPLTDDSSSQKS